MLGPQLVDSVGRVRRCSFVGGGVSLEQALKFQKPTPFQLAFSALRLLSQHELSGIAQHHAGLPAALLEP